MQEVKVSADWREEFIRETKGLHGANLREQLVAMNARATTTWACGNLTETDLEEVQAEIQARLDRVHAAASEARQTAKPLGGKVVEVLAAVEDDSHLQPAKTKARRDHQPLPPEILQNRRRRWDHQSFLAKLARFPAKYFVRFKHGTGAVLAVIIRDIIKLGSCTRSYASHMKEAGVCRATVAACMDLIRDLRIFEITRRRRNSNLITTFPGEIHDYIFKLKTKTQISEKKEEIDPLYGPASQTLESPGPIGAPPAAVQASPVGAEPKTVEATPEPTTAKETARPASRPVERGTVPGFDERIAAALRLARLDPHRREGGAVPLPG